MDEKREIRNKEIKVTTASDQTISRFSPSSYSLPINPIDNINERLDHLILSGSDSEGHILVVDNKGNLRFNVMDDSLFGLRSSKHIILNNNM